MEIETKFLKEIIEDLWDAIISIHIGEEDGEHIIYDTIQKIEKKI